MTEKTTDPPPPSAVSPEASEEQTSAPFEQEGAAGQAEPRGEGAEHAAPGASSTALAPRTEGGEMVPRGAEGEAEEETKEQGRWFSRFFQKAEDQERTPLELRTRLLDTVEQTLKPHRAERPLPFNRLTVHILAPTSQHHSLYEAAIDSLMPAFDQAVYDRLREAGFEIRPELSVKTRLHAEAPKRLQREFETFGTIFVETKVRAVRTYATITVLKGVTEEESYRIHSREAVLIGRLRDVVDETYGHVVRHNDIAFLGQADTEMSKEDQEVNETVSRRHARIEFDARSGLFVLYNESGRTSVGRRSYPQPVRVGRQPVPLEDGDLIYLGRACLCFEAKRR